MKKILLSIFVFISLVNVSFANELSVRASISPSEILIGEQAKFRIELTQSESDIVSWPVFADSLTTSVPIIEKLTTDTTKLENNKLSVVSEYLITSYDSGYYYIPEFVFETTTDKCFTNPLQLTVNTVSVNAETDDIKPEKDVMSAPFSWIEFAQWTGVVLGILLLIALIVLLVLKFCFKKKVKIIPEQPEIIIPAHIVALQKLEEIKAEKLWQSGDIKLFYTRLTDVIREYLEKAYNINAMELTTEEIVALVKKNKDLEEIRLVLKEMLEISDLVKFAKYVPLDNVNEASVLNAFMIVEKTTKVAEPKIEKENVETDKTGKE